MALRDECGYEGAQPYVFIFLTTYVNIYLDRYWDWSEDSDLPNL